MALEPLTGALPSPKLIVLETIVPSGSLEPAVEAVMLAGAVTDPVTELLVNELVMLNAAVGGWLVMASCTPLEILLVSVALPTALTKIV